MRCVMRMQLRLLLFTAIVAGVFTQLPGPGAALSRAALAATASGDAVIVWNAHAGEAAMKACIAPLDDPFHESRMYAMMHIAIHDALNAIDRRFQPYAFDKRVEPGASPEAAVAAAARDVMVPLLGQLPRELPFITQACIDASLASVEAAYSAAIAALPDGPAKTQGIAAGQAAAAAILTRRTADGAVGPFLNTSCPQDTSPGKYQCTPGYQFVAFEVWGKVTPFALQDSAQFRPGPPYAVTEIAYFWWESSPLKWSRIARSASANSGFSPWQNARLFALLSMALADGYVAMSATKNHYSYWRPVTAIRAGEADGNPDTTGDPAWTPLRPTPPNQDYASGHSIEGGVGAEVLKQVFGTDGVSFQDCGVKLPAGSACGDPSPVLRPYSSFSQAATENAFSRILIGFHFRRSIEEGTQYGRKIGERAATTYLRPVA